MAEMRPALMAALHREWYGDPNRKLREDSDDSDDDSDDGFSYYDPDAEFSDSDCERKTRTDQTAICTKNSYRNDLVTSSQS